MLMSFTSDLELSNRSRHIQDRVYQELWQPTKITRFDKPDNMILDRLFHIDVAIRLGNGQVILGQEKALRYKFSHFNTFTIEHHQNRHTGEGGEFFNLGAQFYFHGYLNEAEDALCKWVVIKVFDFVDFIQTCDSSLYQIKPTGTSQADFMSINYDDIPESCIYAINRG
jgi:hypothetical protein